MANVKINDLAVIAAPASTDVLPIVDVTLDTTNKISIADILKTAPDGTFSAPSIAFEGDSNTGIYHPGSEQIGFTTSGSEAVRIDSAGNVGIGTSNPDTLLNLSSSTGTASPIPTELQIATTSNGGDWSLTDPWGRISFYSADASSGGPGIHATIDSIAQGNGGFSRLSFTTKDSTSLDLEERLTITRDGFVGIGTTDPGQILTVENNDNPAILLNNSNSSNASSRSSRIALNVGGVFAAGIRASVPASGTASDADLQFASGGDATFSKMRITSDGNVGIGTTSPSAPLSFGKSVYGESSSEDFYRIKFNNLGGTTNDVGIGQSSSINLDFNGQGGFRFLLGTSGEAARIDSSGRLLVGTSSPITVNSEAGGAQADTFGIQSVGRSNASSLLLAAFPDSTSNARGSTFALVRSNGDEAVQTIVAEDNDLGSVSFQGSDGTNFVRAANIKAVVDGTPEVEDMPGRLVFSTTASGANTPTERMRIKANGSILFADEDESAITAGTSNGKAILSSSIMYSARATTAAASHIIFTNTNGIVGQISTSGSNTAFSTSSDYRLKENVVPLANAADRLNQLQVHRFNFIADPNTTVDGFLAHEAQAVVPECVTGTKDEVDDEGNPVYQGIDQSKIVPLLTAALQEALAKIETLEQRLNDAGL